MTLFDLKKYSLKGSELTGNQILYLSNEILNPTQYSKLKNSIQKKYLQVSNKSKLNFEYINSL